MTFVQKMTEWKSGVAPGLVSLRSSVLLFIASRRLASSASADRPDVQLKIKARLLSLNIVLVGR